MRAYEFILEARFDQVEAELRRACGPAPPEACNVLDATALWWRIQLDPDNPRARSRIPRLGRARDPHDRGMGRPRAARTAEAWFYLGGAYGARVQWRVLRGEKVAAARDGKQIKQALERAIVLEPGLDDAYFGLGMYKYLRRCRAGGGENPAVPAAPARRRPRRRPARNAARAQPRPAAAGRSGLPAPRHLSLVRAADPARASSCCTALQARHPGNPLYLAQIAQIQDTYEHDVIASLETWRTLLAAAREQRANNASARRSAGATRRREDARSGVPDRRCPRASEGGDRTEAARAVLVAGAGPSAAGEAHDRLGARHAALAAYKSALATVPPPDPYDVRRQRDRTHPPRAGRASRRGLPALARRLASARAQRPARRDGRARTRDRADRRTIRSRAIGSAASCRRAAKTPPRWRSSSCRSATAATCPAPILGNAHLEAARLHERLGRQRRSALRIPHRGHAVRRRR